ncbi:MAG: PIF1 family DEAD/DEAH box helicase [Patescibacteria group bacterium]|nr:PIF1 family DEAD/DEAH box helicase [Patescibacteria group bacterium]
MKQKRALEILKKGHNVLLTGAAGSGKTFVLNKFIRHLRKKEISGAITASTGIAATHINGRTIHSWAGLGINHSFPDKVIKKIIRNKKIRKNIRQTKTLIIDEISMLNDYHLDIIDHICKAIKQSLKPFGGIQIVLSGDFFQLPPISVSRGEGSFVNEAVIWNNMNLKVCYLTEQHRQADKKYLKFLNDMRSNNISKSTKDIVLTRLNKKITNKLTATKLYTHNFDVDTQNNNELKKIKKKAYGYEMKEKGQAKLIKTLKKNCLSPEYLILKKGAIVMFVKNNLDKGYVNGTLGQVISFNEGFPVVKTLHGKRVLAKPTRWIVEEDNKELASIHQIPLRLAWAITVHKCQGMTLDLAEIDLSASFTPGMGYVALSRLRKLSGLKLVGINEMAFAVSENAVKLDKELAKMSQENE